MWVVNKNATIYQNTMDFTIWFFPLLQLFGADTTSNNCTVSVTHKRNKKNNHEISFWCQFFIHHLLKRKPFSYVIHILWPHQFGNTLLCALSVYWLDHMRQKTEFIWIQWKNLRKNWNKLISLRWVCASQIAQEDYISFFFFVPHLNVSASPKLIRWPRAHILITYTGWIYLRDAANSEP